MAFKRVNGDLGVYSGEKFFPVSDIVAKEVRPFYLYNLDDAKKRAEATLKSGFSVHFAMKANSHSRLLSLFAKMGMGVDVVSLGELQKALNSGFSAHQVIFSGVGKDQEELSAALYFGIHQINIESFQELKLLNNLCESLNKRAAIALRLNIHLPAPTHKYVQTAHKESKFGIDLAILPEVLSFIKSNPRLELKALAVHIGSQILETEIFYKMAHTMGKLYGDVKRYGIPLERLDLGGGLGIAYQEEDTQDFALWDQYVEQLAKGHKTEAKIVIEPGRFLVARMGALVAKTVYIKHSGDKKFAILNSGMNALLRPALYQAYHRIVPVKQTGLERNTKSNTEPYTVVGPICESSDVFAEDREMEALQAGDWVAILDSGAYGSVMASTYNETPLPRVWSVLCGKWEVGQ